MRSVFIFFLLSAFLTASCVATSKKKNESDGVTGDVVVDVAVSDISADSGSETDQTAPPKDATEPPADGGGPDTPTVADAGPSDTATVDAVAADSAAADVGTIESGCTPEEQEAVFSVNPGIVIQLCIKDCGAGDVQCVQDCFAEKTGVSLECASCFAQTYACILENCADVCEDVTTEECEQCAAENGCFEEMVQCVGIDLGPPEGEEGMCQGPDMEAVAEAGDETDALLQVCNEGCDFDAACMQDCMAAELGISAGCAQCFGAFTGCVAATCKAECSDFTSEGCNTCLKDSGCKDMLFSCTGVYTEPLGACAMADLTILGEQGDAFPLLLKECWELCGDPTPECLGDCIEEKLGMSESCSDCYGDMFACAFNHCPVECKDSIDSEVCALCVEQAGCFEYDCFGFGAPPPEDDSGSDDGPPPPDN